MDRPQIILHELFPFVVTKVHFRFAGRSIVVNPA